MRVLSVPLILVCLAPGSVWAQPGETGRVAELNVEAWALPGTDPGTLRAATQAALGRVQTLSGLLPICAPCRKIRNDNGNCVCPSCVETLYPENALHT